MFTKSIFGGLLATGFAAAHMEMSWPYPIRSEFDPQNGWNQIDYSMTNPLNADGSDFPCKGYQNDPWRTAAQYTAGGNYNMTIAGNTPHSGGSCQLSLSYDNGATFKVIKSMEGGCPLTTQYDFVIPANAPNGHALFAWTWYNLVGNRELYMNCAQVEITGGTGSDFASTHPDIFVANVNNGCETVEGKQTVFAHPGDQIVYDQGNTPNSKPFPLCGNNVPSGSSTSSTGNPTTTTKATSTSSFTTVTTTTTTTAQSTTTSAPSGTVPQYGQCGGNGYTGPTQCAAPYTCVAQGAWWSSCQ